MLRHYYLVDLNNERSFLHRQWMEEALSLARKAGDDIPIGALVYNPSGQLLGAAHNQREALGDPTAHAEILALRQAALAHGDGWRLENCTLVVTVEPCSMCAGAAINARVGAIVFGAWEPKTGAAGSLWDLPRDPRLNHNPEVYGGVLEVKAAALMRDFFSR